MTSLILYMKKAGNRITPNQLRIGREGAWIPGLCAAMIRKFWELLSQENDHDVTKIQPLCVPKPFSFSLKDAKES